MTRNPGKIAVVHGGRSRTYHDFVARMDHITRAIVGTSKLRRGQNAAIVSRNCIEYLELILGVPEAGVPMATLSPRLTPSEIRAICDDAQARVLFADTTLAAALRATKFKTVERVIEIGPELEAWIASAPEHLVLPQIHEWDIWTIPYTSGTTGQPKGVMLSHRARLLNFFAKAAEYGCYSPDDAFLSITPMNHGPGVGFPINALVFGGSVEVMDRFDPEAVLRRLKHGGFTGVFMVPTHFHEFFALPREVLEQYARPPLKAIICNAAPLPQQLKPRILDYFGPVLHELYSSTETSLVCNLRPADQLRKQRCVGLPFAHTLVKIIDAQGKECAHGEIGELYSNSPYIFSGYWNRPEETAKVFNGHWVGVGDLAKRDEEGFIYIVDRKTDMVISGGVNIYPREVEEVLATHPDIEEAAVVGVPDEKWGERLRLFVVTRSGEALTAEQVKLHCDGKLSPYKIPKDVVLLKALPRNANGKVLKKELRRRG
jgi:long-chain acyl-CoA synthetase